MKTEFKNLETLLTEFGVKFESSSDCLMIQNSPNLIVVRYDATSGLLDVFDGSSQYWICSVNCMDSAVFEMSRYFRDSNNIHLRNLFEEYGQTVI